MRQSVKLDTAFIFALDIQKHICTLILESSLRIIIYAFKYYYAILTFLT